MVDATRGELAQGEDEMNANKPVGQLCTGCSSSWNDERLAREKRFNPRIISCCPERKMVDVYAQEPIKFLEDGTRYKVSLLNDGCCITGLPKELAGEWVALVKANNDEHLKGIQQINQWIPASERLPENGQSVAFVVKSDIHDYLHGRVLGGRYSGGISGGFSVPGMTCLASHWMPLPEAPKEAL